MTIRKGRRENVLGQINQVVAYGNSIVANAPVIDRERDIMTRFAQMVGAREFNYAKSAARMAWHTDAANNRWGVVPMIFQTHYRPRRAGSIIATTDPAVGATSVTVSAAGASASGPAFKQYDTIHIGSGNTGANGGEVAQIASIAGNVLNLDGYENQINNEGGLVRDHALGEPVFVVPTQFAAGNTVYLLCESHNHLAAHGVGTVSQRVYQHALRSAINRLRAAEIYEADHPCHTVTGSWTAGADTPATSSGRGNGGLRRATALNSSITLNLPNNWEGGTAFMQFVSLSEGTSATWSFTVDGVSAGTITVEPGITSPAAQSVYMVKRFTGLAAGRHQIVATLTALGTGQHFYDFGGVEAKQPPIVVVFKAHRLYRYGYTYGSAFDYGHIDTALSAGASAGATSIQMRQRFWTNQRSLSATVPAIGETVTLEPGTANEETVTITGAGVGIGPWTYPCTTLTKNHPSAVAHIGIKDFDIPIINGWIDSICDEFDDWVVRFDPDLVTRKQPSMFIPLDGVHFSEVGAATAAQALFDQLAQEDRLNSAVTSRLARPTQPLPGTVNFLHTGVTVVWTNMPAAQSEFPLTTGGPGVYRRPVDFSRAYEARLIAVQTAAGATNAKMGVQYLADDDTTWRWIHRKLRSGDTDPLALGWEDPTAATDVSSWLSIGALPTDGMGGLRVGPWFPIPFDALRETRLRINGIGGDGALDPAFTNIYLEYR